MANELLLLARLTSRRFFFFDAPIDLNLSFGINYDCSRFRRLNRTYAILFIKCLARFHVRIDFWPHLNAHDWNGFDPPGVAASDASRGHIGNVTFQLLVLLLLRVLYRVLFSIRWPRLCIEFPRVMYTAPDTSETQSSTLTPPDLGSVGSVEEW